MSLEILVESSHKYMSLSNSSTDDNFIISLGPISINPSDADQGQDGKYPSILAFHMVSLKFSYLVHQHIYQSNI